MVEKKPEVAGRARASASIGSGRRGHMIVGFVCGLGGGEGQ